MALRGWRLEERFARGWRQVIADLGLRIGEGIGHRAEGMEHGDMPLEVGGSWQKSEGRGQRSEGRF
jgi:hypothetical protein